MQPIPISSKVRWCLKKTVFTATLVMWLMTATLAMAGLPTELIRETNEKLVAILEDPDLMGEEKLPQKKVQIGKVADERVDWHGLCQRCLGRHWRKRTAEEKKLFISTLTRFVKIKYTNQIHENFGNLKEILYQDESKVGSNALVKIKLVTKDYLETPILYRMKSNSDGSDWEIIDIVIEGTSMVKIYRTQFDDILRNGTFDELIEKIKDKTTE